jgi:SAM-dependent methyltransferase
MRDAAKWDERYGDSDLVWTAEPNRWVAEAVAGLPPGRAIDLAAGEGRNAIWLAGLGWTVTAVDFSRVGLDKGRRLAEGGDSGSAARICWEHADLLDYQPPQGAYDLVLLAYLHLPASSRRTVLRRAGEAVAPGGRLLVVGHDRANLERGVGGPQDPDVLYAADDLRTELADLQGTGLTVESAQQRLRPVDGHERPAVDLVLLARRI